MLPFLKTKYFSHNYKLKIDCLVHTHMHVNSWLQKFHGTQNIMTCHDKYYCHKFKTQKVMVSQKIMDCHENL